jgi:hypothetical protein
MDRSEERGGVEECSCAQKCTVLISRREQIPREDSDRDDSQAAWCGGLRRFVPCKWSLNSFVRSTPYVYEY